MNPANMTPMNAGNPVVGGMPMMNNIPNGAMARQVMEQDRGHDDNARLNTWIYSYLMEQGQWAVARSLKESSLKFFPALINSADDTNGTNDDSKEGPNDSKRPPDLPIVKTGIDNDGGSMLAGWFTVFWDIYHAHKKDLGASKAATQVMEHNRMRGQTRGDQMFRAMNGMAPNPMDPNLQQMMRMNPDLRQKALQNQQQNGFRSMTPQMQMAALQQQRQNAMMQGVRRDASAMDMNGPRPRSPSNGEHAPSPKRARMEGAGFNPQMMANGRPPPGMPPTMVPEAAQQANALLVNSGINPANLSDTQYASFQQQNPSIQQKSIQVYAQNQSMIKNPPEDMNMVGGPEFYGANPQQMLRANAMGQNPGAAGTNGNHALQDYQMQLMLLEQQNKKRLLMARQEQDGPGQPGMPAGFAPGMSPQGSRGGPSPGPPGERRGTPKIGAPGMDGSPMPDGSLRGSPAAMPQFNPAQAEMYAMASGGRPPPGTPQFAGQFNPQQLQQMAQMRPEGPGRMPGGNWPGPVGQNQNGQPMPMQQQPPQMGTPQQRNDMPPPQPPAAGAMNGRNGADETPPTPQPANKNNPKTKKDQAKKGEGKAKKGATSVAATPAAESEKPPPTPTPNTPITPSHPNSFSQKENGHTNANQPNGNVPSTAPAQDVNVAPSFTANVAADEQPDGYNGFQNDQMGTGNDLLDNFNFEEFLDNNAFNLDLGAVDMGDIMETPTMADAA